MLVRVSAVAGVCVVQVTPSGDVRIVPSANVPVPKSPPTATNCVPDHVTSMRKFVVPELRGVQVTPSGEVRIVPPTPENPPTATNCVPDQVTPCRRFVVPEV
jgi:hypothetical protein